MEAFGASAEQIESLKLALHKKNTFDVWPENWHALQILSAAQWQVVGTMGGLFWAGIDRNSLPYIESRIAPDVGAKKQPDDVLFRQLQIAEQAILPILNKVNNG